MIARLHHYHLPLHKALQRSDGPLHDRRSIVLSIGHADTPTLAYGEATPMPLHGGESYEHCLAALEAWTQAISSRSHIKNREHVSQLCSELANTPCAQFCAQSACLDYLARAEHVSLAHYLHPQATNQCKLNALITDRDDDFHQGRQVVATGYTALKYKCALDSVDAEITRFHKIASQCTTSTRLRLDCNQAWTYDQAQTFIDHALQSSLGQHLDYIEDPCADLDTLCDLAKNTACPIALDVTNKNIPVAQLAAETSIAVFVIKPMLYGDIIELCALYQKIIEAGKRCVFTSFIEGNVGRSSVAHICAACDREQHEYHGLDTAKLLTNDNARGTINWQQPVIHITDHIGNSITELL